MKHLVLIMALLQIPFLIHNPAFWWNGIALGFCSALCLREYLKDR